MGRAFPLMIEVRQSQLKFYFCSTPLAIGLLISVFVLLALCAQHSRKVSSNRNYSTDKSSSTTPRSRSPPSPRQSFNFKKEEVNYNVISSNYESDHPPLKSPLRGKKNSEEESDELEKMYGKAGEENSGLLWQKAIMMGEKCQPPEFSGVLFYDSYGNRISELPRSPRALPVRNISSFAQNA